MKKIYLLFLIGMINFLNAQIQEIKSPQSSEFERYGNIPTNLYTGGINYNIPLFSLNYSNSEGSKPFSLGLTYNSSGFIPTKKSNYVGFNWFLNFGGVITRETIGVDDEYAGETGFKGFLYAVKNSRISNTDLYNGNYKGYRNSKSSIEIKGYQTELTPDKFHFNFMGISGYFYINIEGKVIVTSSDPNLSVDIKGFGYQYDFSCTPEPSEIIMTDGYGNKYFFGGNYNNLELSYNQGLLNTASAPMVSPNRRKRFSIKGWYLNKIKFYDDKTIIINYKMYDEHLAMGLADCNQLNTITYGSSFLTGRIKESFYDLNKVVSQKIERFDYNYNIPGGVGGHVWGSSWSIPYFNINLIKKVLPNEIIFEGIGKIKFNYNEYPSQEKGYSTFLLNNVRITNNISEISNINFKYERTKDFFFLQELELNSQKYNFEYYNKNNLPPSTTFGIDHWGYWNGKNDLNNHLIPQYRFNALTGDYKIIGNSREPNPDLKDVALLKKVVYPTRGYSEFIYEPHTYSKKIDRNSSSLFLRTIINENGFVGGARIKKIINNDGYNNTIQEFKYLNLDGKSSGILKDMQRYLHYDEVNNRANKVKMATESNNNYLYTTFSNSPIEYKRIVEFKNNQKFKEYIFSTYEDSPDSINSRIVNEFNMTYFPTNLNLNLYRKYNDNSNSRGNLLKEVSFKNANEIVQKVEYKYTRQYNKTIKNNYVSSVIGALWGTTFHKEYMFPNLKKHTTITLYTSNKDSIKTKEIFDYQKTHRNGLIRKEIQNSKGEAIITEYTYPSDLWSDYAGDREIYSNMEERNMESLPIFIRQKINDKYISETFNSYEEQKGKINLRQIFRKKSNIKLQTFKEDFDINPKNRLITYNSYDNKGNITQYTPENGVPVSIIWGYNGQYPIAKIEGVNYADVSSFVATLENASNNGSLTKDSFTNLRNALPKAMITTYVYKPLVGVTSITGANGQTEYYKYDAANRLQEIKNDKGEVLKTFEYNYKN